jgi:hypothetical protein
MRNVPLNFKRLVFPKRSGATLSEVLVAILIMSIGLVGVMSLFPVSVLRSVQAHALTSAANLRFSAESALASYPQIVADPDRANNGIISDLDGDGNRWNDQAGQAFIVDPFLIATRSPAINHGDQIGGPGTIRVWHAGFNSLVQAENVFSSPDKWTVKHEEFPAGGALAPTDSPQSVTLNGLSAQQVYVGLGLAPTRVVIFNKVGNSCQVRAVDPAINPSPLPNSVSWQAALPTPYSNSTFGNADIGNVRLEQRDLHFTWMLTIRGNNAADRNASALSYDATITVFYKRGYPDGDFTGFGNGANLAFQKGSVVAQVTYGPAGPPFLKRGSWVLDATNGLWYQIETFVDDGAGTVNLTLASQAREHGRTAVFMKAIVDVYPISPITIRNPPAQ